MREHKLQVPRVISRNIGKYFALVASVATVLVPRASGSITEGNHWYATCGSGTTCTFTASPAISAGNTLVIRAVARAMVVVSGIDNGLTFKSANIHSGIDSGGTNTLSGGVIEGVPSAISGTVTISFTGAPGTGAVVRVDELHATTGTLQLFAVSDMASNVSGTGSFNGPALDLSLATANLWVGEWANVNNGSTIASVSSPWTSTGFAGAGFASQSDVSTVTAPVWSIASWSRYEVAAIALQVNPPSCSWNSILNYASGTDGVALSESNLVGSIQGETGASTTNVGSSYTSLGPAYWFLEDSSHHLTFSSAAAMTWPSPLPRLCQGGGLATSGTLGMRLQKPTGGVAAITRWFPLKSYLSTSGLPHDVTTTLQVKFNATATSGNNIDFLDIYGNGNPTGVDLLVYNSATGALLVNQSGAPGANFANVKNFPGTPPTVALEGVGAQVAVPLNTQLTVAIRFRGGSAYPIQNYWGDGRTDSITGYVDFGPSQTCLVSPCPFPLGITPYLSTTAASSITATSATAGGNITSDATIPVTDRGVCVATHANPTKADTCISEGGTTTGSFSVTLSNLTGSTGYHIAAYATNANGTNYGSDRSFTTLADVPLSSILDASRYIDWRGIAGVAGGIPTNWPDCTSAQAGVTVPIAAYTGTAATINTAFANCAAANPNGSVLKLGAGTFALSTMIDTANHSNVTYRGAGPLSTILRFTGYGTCGSGGSSMGRANICVRNAGSLNDQSADTQPGGAYAAAWTDATITQGQTQITLTARGASFPTAIGSYIFLDQLNEMTDNGSYLVCGRGLGYCSIQGADDGGEFGRGSVEPHRSQIQIVKVTGVNGNTYTISPGIFAPNYRQAQTPGAWSIGTFATRVGIEDLTIDGRGSATSANIKFYGVANSWMKNVRSLFASQTAGVGRDHVLVMDSANVEVRDSYFFGSNATGSQQAYTVELAETSNILVENNIFDQCVAPTLISQSTGSVIGYNYSTRDIFSGNVNWLNETWTHDAGSAYLLLEGNHIRQLASDDEHGGAEVITVLRNQIDGNMPSPNAKTLAANAIQLSATNRGWNILANSLGTAGFSNYYETYPPSTGASYCNSALLAIGWSGNCTQDSSGLPNDTLVRDSMVRWGNYDTFNNTVRFVAGEGSAVALSPYIAANSTPGTQSFPASAYLSAKPSWFGATPYPPIGPDVTGGSGPGGYSYAIPAESCVANTAVDSSYAAYAVSGTSYSSGTVTLTIPAGHPFLPSATAHVIINGVDRGLVMLTAKTATTISYAGTNPGNYSGTAYLPVLNFDASACYSASGTTAPSVTTGAPSSIGSTAATVGGNVTSNGGASIITVGTCYATTANPSTPCTSDAVPNPDTSPWSSNLTGLTPATLYHYRAYATNSAGTSYGSDQSFITSALMSGDSVSGAITCSGATMKE